VIAVKIRTVQYSLSTLDVKTLSSLENVQWKSRDDTNLWLDLSEYENIEDIRPLEKEFNLHPLALEDCVHVRQRPKIDEFNENLFFICRMIRADNGRYVEGHQLGIFLGKNFVITVHKEGIPEIDDIFKQIAGGKTSIVQRSASFLLYAILDVVVDTLEEAVKEIEQSECTVGIDVLKDPPPQEVLDLIYINRGNLLLTSRLLRSQSHVVNRITKGDLQLINGDTAPFFRDIHDHTSRAEERINNLIDVNMGSLNIYSSSISNGMNQVIKLLTVISTIIMPLTVVVGWFGMNIEMPGTEWPIGYATVLLLIIGFISVAVLIFRRKGWL
jgi:magnesium transporter